MSSNIEITRICIYCNNEFVAKTSSTKYCSHKCNQRHYKDKDRQIKIKGSNKETIKTLILPLEKLKAKEFLTVKEVSKLLNCSIRTVYFQINRGNIEAVNLGERMTRIKRSALDKLFKN